MKRILIILITIPLIFNSCKKEEEDNQPNNNNSSLTIEQTMWEVSSFQEKDNNTGQTYPMINIPCGDQDWDTGIDKIEWTFFNNEGFFVEKWINGYNNTSYDTSNYSYFPNLDMITLTDYSQDGDGNILDGWWDCQSINIIDHSSTNLEIEFCDTDYEDGCVRVYLTRVN